MKYFIFLIAIALLNHLHAQQRKITPLPIGSEAPDFNLPGVDGRMHSLEDFGDYSILVVIFTCNHCPTAQAYEDKIIDIVGEYEPRGVGFVAISPNSTDAISLSELGYTDLSDGLEDMKIRAGEKEFNFPYLYDGETQEASMQYGPVATPHVFVFDKERFLRYSGRIDDTENPYIAPRTADLRNALDALLAGRDITTPATKTFGCSVKWAWKGDWVRKQRAEWAAEPVEIQEVDLEGIADLVANDGDKLRLINIWATWCGPCVMEFPSFIGINRMYRHRDFEFISLSLDKLRNKDKALDLLGRMEASNENFIFAGDYVYDVIDVFGGSWQGSLPYTALIAPGGEVLYSIEGMIDPLDVKRGIVGYLGRYYADEEE